MVKPSCRVKKGGFQIIHLKVGHLFEYLFRTEAGGEKVEHIHHTDAHATDARPPAALLRVDSNSFEKFRHRGPQI